MSVALLLEKIRLSYGSDWRLYGTICVGIQQHERTCMVLSQLRPACVPWLWSIALCVSLSGCSGAYHFRYQYTMVTPDSGSGSIENDRVRVQVTPTPEVGVLQLAVMNKS